MNTKQIDYILELAQTLNFNRAAENLFISQPSLTYQIRAAEEEIGFDLFFRSGKGASLTPAGAQFVTDLRRIREELNAAIEHGQNFSGAFSQDIRLALPIRSALHLLPKAIEEFSRKYPSVSVTPSFDWGGCLDSFMKGEQDVLFAMEHEVRRMQGATVHHLFDSRFYLITKKDDPLASKASVSSSDISGRTLMIGGGSPPVLKQIQQRVLSETGSAYFNSRDHDTTLTNVAAGRGVCIAPGVLNDRSGEFAWVPFECSEVLPCVLCTHKDDSRWSVMQFISLIQELYAGLPENFPL